MPKYRKFIVEPSLPEKLKPLEEIAYNLWWSWNPDAINLLRRIDFDLWEEYHHNPVMVIGSASADKLKELEEDDGFLRHTERVLSQLNEYMESETWFDETYGDKWSAKNKMAYFSLEFGIDECLPIYSGGLGVLAGDHLKSASDLGLPLVAVGLAYSHGYFTQYLNPDGYQQEVYPENNFHLIPQKLERDDAGLPLKVAVPFPGRTVYAHIWKAKIGRVNLYLLDTNIVDNSPHDRELTAQLYGGGIEMRIEQEIILGVGGVKALGLLGEHATAYHMNEGHSAFLSVERIRHLMEKKNFGFYEAKEACIASTVFTTHTPVPAGNDRFESSMVRKYLEPVANGIEMNFDKLIALGKINPDDRNELFCMTVFALRLSSGSNGVSKLHGEVSRKMWHEIWKELPENLVPIKSITNGIHIRTWISEELRNLFERYIGVSWINKPGDDSVWKNIKKIPDSEMWKMHERRREKLVAFARKRLKEQLRRRGGSEAEIQMAEEALDPEALTIGFARRFATYKRGTLILKDIDRLAKILCNKNKPVQMIFAGKAHPADAEGKKLIKDIIHAARINGFRQRLVFVENYDIDVARYLVQGCDIWLNNPRRPLEASGTSGMKAAANGILNLSILDGWWDEGYSTKTGWAIGHGESYDDQNLQDVIESKSLYDILEQDITRLFYDRGSDGIPRGWIRKMKSSMTHLIPIFNTNRMVREYADNFYLPQGKRWQEYVEEDPTIIKSLATWKLKMKELWCDIKVVKVDEGTSANNPSVGETRPISAIVQLGKLKPDELRVECYYGTLNKSGEVREGKTVTLDCVDERKDGIYSFSGKIPCASAGLHGYAIRILPKHKNLFIDYTPGLIFWG